MSSNRLVINSSMLKQQIKSHETSIKENKATHEVESRENAMMLPVSELVPSPFQPRTRITEDDIVEMADQLKIAGRQLTPCQVYLLDNGKYELIDGERRWRGVMHIGWTHVWVVVVKKPDNLALWATMSNIFRKQMSDFEEARAHRTVEEELGEITIDEICNALKVSSSNYYRYRAFFDLPPEALDMLIEQPFMISRFGAEALAGALKKARAQNPSATAEANQQVIQAMKLIQAQELSDSDAGAWVLKQLESPSENNQNGAGNEQTNRNEHKKTQVKTDALKTSYDPLRSVFQLNVKNKSLANRLGEIISNEDVATAFEEHLAKFVELQNMQNTQ